MNYHWSELWFAVGFIVYTTIRGRYINRAKQVETEFARVDWQERILFVLLFLGNLLIPILYLLTPLFAFANYKLPPIVTWCGAILMPISLWLFWRSHVDLGDNWSVTLEIRKKHQLVRHGVYRTIRHPMYAAFFLFGLAQGFLLHNWFAGWSALASLVLLYLVRVPREERMMRDVFGQAYADYQNETGRIIPKLFG